MKVAEGIAQALKREGVEILFAYPVNPLIEACAVADIRTVIVRQERVGLASHLVLMGRQPVHLDPEIALLKDAVLRGLRDSP